MKKIIAGIILLIFIAVVLSAPLFVGIAAEKEINEQINKLALSADVTISNIYKRNWFTSNAETTFSLSKLLDTYSLMPLNTIPASESINVRTRSEIIHGPFSFKRFYSKQPMTVPVLGVMKNVTTILFPQDVVDFTPAITTYISIYPNGSGSGIFTIPETNYSVKSDDKLLKFSEIEGEISFSSDMSKLFFSLNSPELLLKELDNELEITGLELSLHSDKKNSNLFFNTTLSIKSLKGDNVDSGPAVIELSGKRIKKDVYKQLISLLSDLDNKSENQFAHILLITQIMGLLPELLLEAPEINLTKFDIKTSEGVISANASIKVDKSKLNNPNDLKGLIRSIDFDFSILIPDSIAEKHIFDIEHPRSEMLHQMMIKKGNNYSMELKYINARFYVNGKPFSIGGDN